MKKLKECKNFGELYEVIGEENFGTISYALTVAFVYLPLVAGLINYSMTVGVRYYDPYEYNYKCMTLWNFVFSMMALWLMIYFIGKTQKNSWNAKIVLDLIKQRQKWLIFWLALFAWTIIPVAFSCNPMGALWGNTFLGSGYISHFYTLCAMLCVYMIKEDAHREKIIWHFIIVSDILAMIMLAFEYNIPFLKIFTLATGVSTYTNSNHYGYIITMAYMAVLGLYYREQTIEKKERNVFKEILCVMSMVINAYALMINDTLGAYLAIVFAALIVLPLWRIRVGKIGIKALVPLFILGVFTVLSYNGFIISSLGSTIGQSLVVFVMDLFRIKHKSEGYKGAGTGRLALWIETIDRIRERPILGYGPDLIVDKDNVPILSNTPHNEFLECAFFMGIPGLALYLGGLVKLCIDKCRTLKNISINELIAAGIVLGYLTSSFFGVRKFNTVCYFFMFLGILMRNASLKDVRKSTRKSNGTKP
ncbi:MAG: O-antigen ligase family protein [Lachnospiraceae bacterium]|nr:O-antigen ligase family protein [Lachnospiraceae bacterium]